MKTIDMKELKRDIEKKFKQQLFDKKKISIIYGPRQSGKTTFVKQILREYNGSNEAGYYNCEELAVQAALTSGSSTKLYETFAGPKVIAFDEAQQIPEIGKVLKLLIDAHPELTIIATGSSSFELANQLNEPLTGRHYEYFLYPISMSEYQNNFSRLQLEESLDNFLIYGSYPAVCLAERTEQKIEELSLLATSYLYKDIFQLGDIRNPELLTKILRALALQVGGEVSYNEIAELVGADPKTVMSYINLLEQAYIVFKVLPLGTNQRNEIKKKPKFYFYDNGILNTLINNYNGEDVRQMGALWENLMMTERRKYNQLHSPYRRNVHYWRLTTGQEVDYVEEAGGKYCPYEFKYRKNDAGRGAKKFAEVYGEEVKVVNRDNFAKFVL